MARDNEQIFYLGAFIFSLVGGILLLATPFCGFDGSNYYLGVWIWGNIGAATETYGGIFILMAVMLIIAAIMALLAIILLGQQGLPFERYELLCFLLTFAVFIMSIIGLIIFGVVADDYDWWWWPDAGFYGGAIGGLIAALFFYLAFRESN